MTVASITFVDTGIDVASSVAPSRAAASTFMEPALSVGVRGCGAVSGYGAWRMRGACYTLLELTGAAS